LTLPNADGPRPEKSAIWSLMSVAPELKTSRKSPGEPPSPQNGPGLPDEKIGMMPAARQAWTVAR
jgi:hypothetical protein